MAEWQMPSERSPASGLLVAPLLSSPALGQILNHAVALLPIASPLHVCAQKEKHVKKQSDACL